MRNLISAGANTVPFLLRTPIKKIGTPGMRLWTLRWITP
jgi:hypothetical protein